MNNWKHWIVPGLVTVVVLTAIAAWLRGTLVEDDLTAEAVEALKSDYPWASVELSGRDLTLSGIAPGDDEIQGAVDAAGNVNGVRIVSSAVELPPLADPFTLSARRNGQEVVLSGNFASESVREAIKQAVSAVVPDARIEDRMTIARGASPDFAVISSYAVAQLAGLDEAAVSISGEAVSITGQAISPEAHKAVSDAMSGNLPAGTLETLQISPAPVSPYVFEASRNEGGILLGGYVPSQASRTAILEHLRNTIADSSAADNMLPASGAPEQFDEQAKYALDQLAGLAEGSVRVSDGALSIEGTATDFDAFDRFGTLGGTLPSNLVLEATTIVQPEIDVYQWAIEAEEGTGISLTGYVPDAEIANRNKSLAEERFGSAARIDDRQRVVNGAPDGFAEAVEQAIQAASRLADGKASISGTQISVTGTALTGVAANEIRNQLLADLPQGFESSSDVAVRKIDGFVEPAVCERLISDELENNVIRFGSGSASISPASFGLLDKLAFHLRRCPDARLEVGGHTDSDGDDAENLTLSEERANAVRQYLVRSGIFFSRLDARGYGETEPVADNSTSAGKARNRRIDFRIVQ